MPSSVSEKFAKLGVFILEDIFWHDCTFGKQVWDRLQNETEYVQIA